MKHQSPMPALALSTFFFAAAAHATPILWVGGGGDNLWSNPANWDAGIVPCNAGPLSFEVSIPAGAGTINFDLAGPCTINELVLGENATLHIDPSGDLLVLDSAMVSGHINALEGDFIADSASMAFPSNKATFRAESAAPASAATVRCGALTYSSTSAIVTGSSTWHLMNANGAGSLIDCSSMTSIDAGFNDGSPLAFTTLHQILAGNGGAIDLSALETVTGPAQPDDSLGFYVWDSGSMDLSSLGSIGSLGNGAVIFGASAGTALELPAASSISSTRFEATTGSTIRIAGAPATYASTALVRVGSSTSTLLRALDAGSLLDMPAIMSIDAGFNDGSPLAFTTHHQLLAGDGGTLNLSGVKSMTAPFQPDDVLGVYTWDGGSIDLGSLDHMTTNGNGRVYFGVYTGASLTVGGLSSDAQTTIEMADSDTELIATGQLQLHQTITVISPAGFTMNLEEGFCHRHSAESSVQLARADVTCVGSATLSDPQMIEAAGLNVGCSTGILTNDNFAFGRLVVGQPAQSTVVQLRDCIDNGNDQFGAEALYLFGQPGMDGLDIVGGSTLVLNGIDVYVFEGGVDAPAGCVHLNALFGPGEDEIPYEGGTIRLLPLEICLADLDGNGVLNLDDVDAFVASFLAGDLMADLDGDCVLNLDDIDLFVASFLAGCP